MGTPEGDYRHWDRDPVGVEITLNEADGRAGRVNVAIGALINVVRKLGLTDGNTIYMNGEVPTGEALDQDRQEAAAVKRLRFARSRHARTPCYTRAMPVFMCNTCGTQFNPADKPPANCPICDDERQFVPPAGQAWTTHEALAKRSYNGWRELEPDLFSITTFPAFGIGQRAQLLRTPAGNILWDCIALRDPATVALVKALGGIKGIAISHPHYYSSMVE